MGTTEHRIGVLFVCMGNICRSPTAEGLFRALTEKTGLAHRIEIDSAGTHSYHKGEPPDHRAIHVAADRGINLSQLKSREVTAGDFRRFDYILAMDRSNLQALIRIRPGRNTAAPRLLLEFAADCRAMEVPDPYYGGIDGYEKVIELIELGLAGLLEEIQEQLR